MEKRDVYELTNPQRNIWNTEQYFSGTNINNVCGRANITEKVDFAVLKDAIQVVLKTNSSFLINFELIKNEPFQYVAPYHFFDIKIIDVQTEEDVKNIEKSLYSKVYKFEDKYLYDTVIYRFPNGTGGFFLNTHHLLGDSWSLGLYCKKVIQAYSWLLENNKKAEDVDMETIPGMASDYTDYCKAEKEYLNSAKFEKDKQYWNEKFETIPEVASLPSKSKKDTKLACKGARKSFEFSAEISKKINDFCKSNNISNFNFITAIYSLYISRCCNLDDFVIGTLLLNRTNYTEKNTTGMFLNTCPLQVDIGAATTFVDLAKNLGKDSLSSLRHQRYPYEYLLKDIRKKEKQIPNLYNILISYQITKTTIEGLKHETSWAFNGNCADELQIHILDLNDLETLNVSYDYKTDKFEEQEITNLHKRIENIINQIITNPDILLNNIEIITKSEKEEILNMNSKKEFNISKSIIEYIEDIAEKNGTKIAIEDSDTSITYKELTDRVSKTANYLINNYNLKFNSNIGIFSYRKIETIIGILAILKINCTYVPIDPSYPVERIDYMVKDSGLSYVLTTESIEQYENNNLTYIPINSSCTEKYSVNFERKIDYNFENNLYIIFTSGSTGNPKGIALKQSNMLNLIFHELYNSNMFENMESLNILQFATMSFDVSYQEIFTALLSAGKIVLISDSSRKNMDELTQYIVAKKINTLFIPPAYLRLLVEKDKYIELLSNSVSVIITAGEALIITKGIQKLLTNNIKIYNHYGPAETHVATSYLVSKNYDKLDVPIGMPISNSKVYILDNTLNLCPKNVLGQIAISGACVGNGYWNNSKLTNEKFIMDPFDKNSKMYLTGDLGYIDSNNLINYIGRSDFQVKINGFRIEPDEITNCLLNNHAIKSAITIIDEHQNKKNIICYYTSDNTIIEESSLKQYLRSSLPNYMIPTKIIKLEKMPLTINGKIDRKNLPKVNYSSETQSIKGPTTPTQKTLSKIWKKIFNTEKISVDYDFFELGGDSLQGIQLISEIKETFKVDLKLSEIYKNSNFSELCKLIDNSSNNYKKITKCQKQEFYPLSNAQKNIYYTSKMTSTPLLYNVCGGLLVDKKLDKNKVNLIFNKIIKNHSAFRTYFKIVDDEPKQFVLEDATINIKAINKNNEDIPDLVNSFVKELDLEKAPILNCEVNYINNKTLLLINTHHIVMDGTSLNILINEFCRLYNDENIEKEKISYTDFTVWENNFSTTEEYKMQEKMWQNEFEGKEIPVISLPYDSAILQTSNSNGNTLYNNIDKNLFKEIEDLAIKLKVSPYTIFLSAFYILLYKYTGQEEIIIGSPISGRFDRALENTLGMFVNNIPLLLNVDEDSLILDFIENVKEKVIKALDNGLYPYQKIKKISNSDSLLDVMFIYQNENEKLPKIDNEDVSVIYANTKTSKFKLSMEIIPTIYKLNIEYNTSIFKKDTINRLFEHYINLLKLLVKETNQKIRNLSLINETEKNLILNKFNNLKQENYNSNILELFKKHVAENPDNNAVIFENEKISYKELDEKSNSLANYLKLIGVKENDVIAINIHRSIELIIAIYASIKSGATYVLIDPSLPEERINYILKDSNAKFGLVDSLTANSLNLENSINIDNFDFKYYDSKMELSDLHNDNLCIIYTSGSTGNPKGVLLHHKGFSSLMYALDETMNISKCKNILGIATVSFDMFAFELYTSTLFGNTLILANEEEQRNSIAMSNLIMNNNVEFLVTTPSRIQLLLDTQGDKTVENVKAILLGGEIFSQDLYKKLRKNTKAKIYNGYGPTEITACCSIKEVTSNKISIGRPLSNSKVYICDDNMNLVPIGIIGEICVAGYGVAKGYINNPKATGQKFIKNPFGEGYLYKTGDMGRYTKKGEIEFLGRTDFQIKIRGLRIELSEVEAHLNSLNSIEKSVVLYNNVDNFAYLTAFVTSKDTINVHDIKTKLSKIMPHYMIPRYIIQLDSFPITINGKVDKKKLSEYKFETTSNINNYIEPTTEMQKIYCEIWNELLNMKVGIDDDLFDIGADSLLAIKFKSRLLAYNIDIPYADIFKYRTVRNLCNIEHSENKAYSNENVSNYNEINELLSKQKNTNIINNKNSNILVLGGTGFIGMHIINDYIRNNKGNVYCIVRDKNKVSSFVRFTELLHFYFGNTLDKYINNRIFVLNGDVLKERFGLTIKAYNTLSEQVDTVINAVANVRHYGKKESFIEANVHSVKTAIDFCKSFNKRLIHISTLSISGNTLMLNSSANKDKFEKKDFTEKDFYIGQSLDNVYSKSKFEAERLVYNEILNNNLNAQVLRLGNITNRYTDGLFQINASDNAFVNKIKSFIELKAMPDYLLNNYMEFTPVDYCAKAIINVLNNNYTNRYVYHIYNDNHLLFSELIKYLEKIDESIDILTEKEFNEKIQEILNTGKDDIISGIINDFDNSKKLNYSSYIKIKGETTKKLLEKTGFRWPKINKKYIKTYIQYFRKINFIK